MDRTANLAAAFRTVLNKWNNIHPEYPVEIDDAWVRNAMLTVADHWQHTLTYGMLDYALGHEVKDANRAQVLADLAEAARGFSWDEIRALAPAAGASVVPPGDRDARLIPTIRHILGDWNGVPPAAVTNTWLRAAIEMLCRNRDEGGVGYAELDYALGPEIHDMICQELAGKIYAVTGSLTTGELRAIAAALPPDDPRLPGGLRQDPSRYEAPGQLPARLLRDVEWILRDGQHQRKVSGPQLQRALLTLADRRQAGVTETAPQLAAALGDLTADEIRAVAELLTPPS